MFSDILQYTIKGNERHIHINSLEDLHNFAHAQELYYNNGILSLQDIPEKMEDEGLTLTGSAVIIEILNSDAEIVMSIYRQAGQPDRYYDDKSTIVEKQI